LTTFLHSQLFVEPPRPTTDFSGKTVIVTGSNTGLGLDAARNFAQINCKQLILAVRSPVKGEEARQSIVASTGREEGCIEIWELDLSSNASVKAFARRAHGLDRLDVVVENAGVMLESFT
jgi:NAD(P)-dependent dehydrogenase (short-subunit alcohol dehydrogenase family)